jgi:deoxycytidylate deaminase
MEDPKTYHEAINFVKRGFHIIGLTGYTGSGCSTAKDILTSSGSPELPGYDRCNESPIGKTILSKRGKRIYEKLERRWRKKTNWEPFIAIEISPIIFGFAVTLAIHNGKIKDSFSSIADECIADKDILTPLEKLWIGDAIPKIDERSGDHKEIINAYEKIKYYYNSWKNVNEKQFIIESMEDYGDTIRKYGKAFPDMEDKIQPQNLFIIPEAIRRLINAYRNVHESKYFVIDAFRNPFEVEFFKWRYAEFYLVGVLCNIDERTKRLDITSQENNKIYIREKSERVKKTNTNISEWICSQDVEECLLKSDIFIDNSKHSDYVSLKFNLIKLLVLSEEPGSIPPTQDERNMQLAATARMMSGCISRQVGAVVTNSDGYVLGIGWNDPPRKQTPCSLRTGEELVKNATKDVFSAFEQGIKFKDFVKMKCSPDQPFCFRELFAEFDTGGSDNKKLEYSRALHAEENAILQAVRNSPQGIEGGVLYTTSSPCNFCAKKAYHMGIREIIYIEEYPGINIEQTIKAGTLTISVKAFEGINGSAYFRLFSSSIPEKDYIQLYLS